MNITRSISAAALAGAVSVAVVTADSVAGPITHVNHSADCTSVTVATGHGWQTCYLSHDDQIEMKEPK